MASTILIASGLSFLGVGVQPPTPTWGNMLQGAQLFLRSAPHSAILPGVEVRAFHAEYDDIPGPDAPPNSWEFLVLKASQKF